MELCKKGKWSVYTNKHMHTRSKETHKAITVLINELAIFVIGHRVVVDIHGFLLQLLIPYFLLSARASDALGSLPGRITQTLIPEGSESLIILFFEGYRCTKRCPRESSGLQT